MAAAAKSKQTAKRGPLGFAAKVFLAIVLGLSFVVIWSTFSSTSSEQQVSSQRNNFEGEIADPEPKLPTSAKARGNVKERKKGRDSSLERSNSNATVEVSMPDGDNGKRNETEIGVKEEREGEKEEAREEQGEGEKKEEQGEGENKGEQTDIKEGEAQISEETKDENENLIKEDVNTTLEGDGGDEEETENKRRDKNRKKKKIVAPLFDPSARYHWKQCGTKSGNNYVPCWDFESDGHQRHHERSCPHTPVMCLVSLPKGYREPLPWPERESKVNYYFRKFHGILQNTILSDDAQSLTSFVFLYINEAYRSIVWYFLK